MTLFNSNDIANLNSTIPLPSKPKKIVIIGAGGIVSDAHLPAYKKAGFEVLGIFDPQKDKATKCAEIFNIEKVYSSEDEAFLEKDVVFDIAVPPQVLAEVVKKIPQGSVCQLQKPMGNSMEDARLIKKIINESKVGVKTVCADFFMDQPIHSVDKKRHHESREVLKKLIKFF